MSHKYDNTVIFSQGGEHGTRIIEWWEKQNVDTDFYLCNKYGFYYGLIDGEFGIYTLDDVTKANAKIIELPVAYLCSTDWKAFARDINKQDLIGRKVRGFKFEDTTYIDYNDDMDSHIGEVGIITENFGEICNIKFKDNWWNYPTSLIHEHLVDEEKVKPHSFCKETGENCTMSYCDENGCLERKRNLVDEDTNVDTSPKIIDLSNVEGVEMMVSDDEENWDKATVVATLNDRFIDDCGFSWEFAKPIEVKKVTMQEVEELFGCRVEIVKEVSNEQ